MPTTLPAKPSQPTALTLRQVNHRRQRVPLILSLEEWDQLEAQAARHGASLGVAASVAVTDWLYRKSREQEAT